MKVLSLELSSSRRAVGLADLESALPATEVGLESGTDPRRTSAFGLIEKVLALSEGKQSVARLAVGLGPGSYTGIRVAISIAQGWVAARPIEIVGIPSVDILVEQVRRQGVRGSISFAFDAQRGEVYLARYVFAESDPATLDHGLRLMSLTEADERLAAGERIVGPDLEKLLPQVTPLFPSAAVLAELARTSTNRIAPEALEPVYLRETTFVKLAPGM